VDIEQQAHCDGSATSNPQNFADDVARKLASLSRTLIAEYEDTLFESHAAECAKIRNSFVEQEVQFRAEIGMLKEKNMKLSKKLKTMSQQLVTCSQPVACVSAHQSMDSSESASSPKITPDAAWFDASTALATVPGQVSMAEERPATATVEPKKARNTRFSQEEAPTPEGINPALAQMDRLDRQESAGWKAMKQKMRLPSFRDQRICGWNSTDSSNVGGVTSTRYMLHPNCMVSMMKDAVSIFVLVWDAVTMPFVLAWDPDLTVSFRVFSMMVSIFWTVEMCLSMRTGYYTNGVLEMRPGKVMWQYIRHWFFIDSIAVVSDWVNVYFDIILAGRSAGNDAVHLDVVRVIKFYRMLRLIRALRMMKVYGRLKNVGHDIIGSTLTQGSFAWFFKIMQYIVYIFWCNHLVACSWYALGKYQHDLSDTGLGWMTTHAITYPSGEQVGYDSVGPAYQYLTCLHYAISSTFVGSLSINPTNSAERAFTVCCLVIGFVLASMLVSSLSSWLVQRQMMRQEKVATLDTLRRFLRENAISTGLAGRIDQHVRCRINTDPRLREDQVDGLELMTPALRGELRLEMWAPHLMSIPLLRTWDGLDSKVMTDLCMGAITWKYLEVGDELFTPGAIAEHAFVVFAGSGLLYTKRLGTNSVNRSLMTTSRWEAMGGSLSSGDPDNLNTVHPGKWLAEIALWALWHFRGTATAISDLEILALSPEALKKVVAKRPPVMQTFVHYKAALEERLSTVEEANLSDVEPGVPHVEAVMGMQRPSRILVGMPALRILRHRSYRPFVRDSLDRLEAELMQGTCALSIDGVGNIERTVRRVALRVQRPDGRVLMEVGPLKAGEREPKVPMLTISQEQEPEEGLSKLLSGELAELASSLTFGQRSMFTTRQTSKAYPNLAMHDVDLYAVYGASVGQDIVLPGQQSIDRSLEILGSLEGKVGIDVGSLQEVYVLNIVGEDLCCTWVPAQDEESIIAPKVADERKRKSQARNSAMTNQPRASVTSNHGRSTWRSMDSNMSNKDGQTKVNPLTVKRLPFPKLLHDRPLQQRPSEAGVPVLRSLMSGRTTDWHRARRAATRICEPEYSCKDFFEDCIAAFPELGLYVIASNPEAVEHVSGMSQTTGGRTTDDEYQRTMGAFFSFYWLMRLGLDGPDSFSFGVNEDWSPKRPPSDPATHSDEMKRRVAFRQNADWAAMHQLLEDAGIMKRMLVASEAPHDPERTLAMLSLTAYHDIMKVQALLPIVAAEHGTWCGFRAGEVIDDHDAALGYVLEYHPDLLPSFAGLPPTAQRSVRFTQCKMEYNMGWLVQAEAPPGALLSRLRSIVMSGNASQQDIAFYFVHWFTDLAGAVPTPLAGSEKFVLGFSLKVLSSFVSSFSIVGHLGHSQSETQVWESYLRWRWQTHKPPLGPPPQGFGAVAKMRLVIMAQGNSKLVLEAFGKLSEGDRRTLAEELARTGCSGQRCVADSVTDMRGPAFLVYYGPAFLQKAGLLDPVGAMTILAELLRVARSMWPLKLALAGTTVTLRIDAMKAETVQACRDPPPGEAWIFEKVSDRSGSVCRMPWPPRTGSDDSEETVRRVLNFGCAMAEDDICIDIERLPPMKPSSSSAQNGSTLEGERGVDSILADLNSAMSSEST